MMSRVERLMAVQLLFESGFVDDASVVEIIGASINALNCGNCYGLTQVLTLRQRYILLQMLAESVLDDVPDDGWHLDPPENMNSWRAHGHSHLAHVAHYMPAVMRRRCHVDCGCWRDVSRGRGF